MKGLLLVFCICSVFFSLSNSQADNEPCLDGAILKRSGKINLGYSGWTASRLNAEVAKIVIEELIGINAEPVFVVDGIEGVEKGQIDVYLELWGSKSQSIKDRLNKPSIQKMGSLGIEGRIGWYIPDYLMTKNPDFQSWRALRFPENAKLFVNGTKVTEDYKPFQQELVDSYDKMVVEFNNCNETVNYESSLNKTKVLLSSLDITSKDTTYPKGEVLAPNPTELWEAYEDQLIQQLKLNLVTYPVNVPSEDNLILAISEKYKRRETFLSYFWTPHQLFDYRSGVNISRVQLMDWVDSCSINTASPECVYPIDNIQKFAVKTLAKRYPRAFNFVQKFAYKSNKDQIQMLGDYFYDGLTHRQAACKWVKLNLEEMTAIASGNVQYPKFTDPDSILVMALTVILASLTLSVLIFVIFFRNHTVITASTQLFCYTFLLGCFFGYGSVFTFIGRPNIATCILRPLLIVLSFVLIYGYLIFKIVLLWKTLNTTLPTTTVNTVDKKLAFIGVGILIFEILLLIIWFGVDTPIPTLVQLQDEIIFTCKSSGSTVENGILWFLFFFNGLFVLAGAFLAFKSRKVTSEFNESRFISLAIYNVIVVCVVMVPLIAFNVTTQRSKFVIITLSVLIVIAFAVIIIFLPKIYQIWIDEHHKRSSRAGSSNSNSYQRNSMSNIDRKPPSTGGGGGGGQNRKVSKSVQEQEKPEKEEMIELPNAKKPDDILEESLRRMKSEDYERPF